MSDIIKGALIVGSGIVIAMCLYLYYSPYQTCVRAKTVFLKEWVQDPVNGAKVQCADLTKNN